MELNWNFTYFIPTEIVFGRGQVCQIGTLARKYGTRAILVTGPKTSRLGPLYDRVQALLASAGVESCHFDGVVPNPTTVSVSAGAALARSFGAEMVIGIGGGSSMDTAKAIAVEASHPGTAWDYLYYKQPPTEKTLPILTIGTTAGTGSQTTTVAVVTDPETRDKSALSNRNLFPLAAIVDPELTATMPPSVTAQTGFDAFCHNFEALLSVRSSPMVEALALDAIRRVFTYLPRAVQDGSDMEARDQMAWVDTLGGITNACAGTTLPHGLGMQIGGQCPHVTHGQALAVQYPSFTRFTRPAAVEKYAAVARTLDPTMAGASDEDASWRCCELIDELLRRIGLWIDFQDLGVTQEDLKVIAGRGQVLGDYKRNPRLASIEEMYQLLISCWGRKA